ncbi:MAG: hypothetical protein ACFFFB_05055 [Candidatus Heimdallarchaeota archaeon]
MAFFEKINGAYFAFLAFIATGAGLLVALMFYLPFNSSYSIFTNYSCDLQAGPIGALISYSIGLVLLAIFSIFLMLYITRDLKKNGIDDKLTLIYIITGVIGQIWLILIGIFPLNPAITLPYEIHRISMCFFFSIMAFNFIWLGYLQYTNTGYSKLIAIIAILAGIFAGLSFGGVIIQEYTPVARNAFGYLSVWTLYVFIVLWLIGQGIYFWKKGK